MVPVKKPIIAAKAPEASAPQKRRPRNTELNSSKRKTGQQALAELRKQKLNCSAGRIPDELKPYYQEITQNEFAKIVGADPDALPGIISDIENEYGEKIVGYVTCKPEYEAAFLEANIDAGFITESGKVLNGVDDGYISGSAVKYAAAHVDDPDLSSSTDQSVNCSEGITWIPDNYMLESIDNALSEAMAEPGYAEHAYLDDNQDIQFFVSRYNPADNTVRVSSADNKSWFRDGVPADANEILKYAKEYIAWLEKNDNQDGVNSSCQGMNCSESTSPDKAREFLDAGNVPEIQNARVFDNDGQIIVLYQDSETGKYMLMDAIVTGEPVPGDDVMEDYLKSTGRLDSTKKLNCSENESGTVYTESGNEVAITDVKVVQNPETNALALFVPENGDDEIPEGFTVIGDVIATASGAPAIEENAETGDDSLNSSKKPPMNRAQRRAAQRGARRPKKR